MNTVAQTWTAIREVSVLRCWIAQLNLPGSLGASTWGDVSVS